MLERSFAGAWPHTGGGSTKSPLGKGRRMNTVKLVWLGSVLLAMVGGSAGRLLSGVNPQAAGEVTKLLPLNPKTATKVSYS